ncbi:ribonuclease R [Reinekea sp.]|uniref:ribonuclease R n=1 Tax=Reinekea sp. TaxID=1970455 RepID=UPI003989B1D8
MKKPQPNADPHIKREAEKYQNPIPSREFITTHLEKRNGPASHAELSDELNLTTEDDIEALRRRLIAMVRDGQLLCSRRGAFGLIDKMDLVRGKVIGHADGFGFLKPDAGGDDLVLNHRQMRCCFDGDVVLARKGRKDHRGRIEGTITEVLERNTQELVGRFHWEGGFGVVRPENRRISQDILIPQKDSVAASDGDIVVVEIIDQPEFRKQPIGRVTKILGEHMAPGMEIDIAMQTYDIPNEWSYEVQEQIVDFTDKVDDADKAFRVDLREKAFVTIDGEDARDFDDAVFAQEAGNAKTYLYVAIADVSHYVGVDTPLDHEARSRGTSVYFPERVIPMLPEILSNGLCSLMPKTDRLSLVCEMLVNDKGVVEQFQFMEAVIHSHARLTYTQVSEVIENESGTVRETFSEAHGASVLANIDAIYGLYKKFKLARRARGSIDFETKEPRIIFNEERKIDRIVATERNEAHKLIEECMLAANVSAATFLETLEIPCLYRVHDVPSFERLDNLRQYMGEQGLEVGGGLKPHAKDYQRLLQQIKDRDDFLLLQTVMLRSMAQAVYQPDNLGHFGLAFEKYAHFTSPIRRYPDLLVHRAIRSVIRSPRKTNIVKRVAGAKDIPAKKIYPYDLKMMFELGEHCSMTERRADEATWDVIAWLKCEYMSDHIGDEFDGNISSVANFGLFVQLDDVFVDGLVHISSLRSDYYQHHPATHRLVGERTRTVYGLGDRIKIRVARVDLDERKIDFELADGDDNHTSRKPRSKNNPGKGKAAAPRKAKAAKGKATAEKSKKPKKGKAKKTGKKKR